MNRFPILARMARDYLAVMATSAASEGQFSIFSDIITKKRNRIEKETANKIICLKSWNIISEKLIISEPDSELELNSKSDSSSDSDFNELD